MAFDPNKITYFAQTDARGKNVKFGIKAKDRQRHVYVIGKTGMGKSTLLENMAVQDILNGEGMAFIDPHGSAAETLLNYIPEHRIKDVLYFAPFDTENPVSFNIMEDVGPDKRHLVVSGLMSVFKKIWIDAWSARMEYILSNTLLALLEYPDSTLLGVNRMLSDKDYRKLVVDNVKDPGVRAFWVDEFAKYNERYMQEAGDAIKNKIGQFTANPIIRNIIGQPHSSFDIRKIMDEKKILIMNLSKGLIGESNANLLGSMLTTRIYLAAMSRADLSPEKMRDMPNFYFFVDEFQSFANATFANILSEARKYHLNLTIAHQYIEQMEEEVRNAVFGNVGTIVSFRVGPFDAEVLETIFTPQFLATDIVNLSFAQIYLTLMIDGIGSQPFSATTLPPIAPPVQSFRDVAVSASRAQFTKSREEVEAMIHKFHEPVVIPKRTEKPVFSEKVQSQTQSTTPRPQRERTELRSPRPPYDPERKERPVVPVHTQEEQKTELTKGENVEQPSVVAVSIPEVVAPLEVIVPVNTETLAPVQVIERRKIVRTSPDDLRDMLKRIIQTPNQGNGKEGVVKNRDIKSDRTELKELLRSVLAEEVKEIAVAVQPQPKPQSDVSIQQGTQEQYRDVTVPSTPASLVSTAVPETHTMTQVNDAPPARRDTPKDTITPKQLERMMRITTSDKPPV
jgi:hypothetical protein